MTSWASARLLPPRTNVASVPRCAPRGWTEPSDGDAANAPPQRHSEHQVASSQVFVMILLKKTNHRVTEETEPGTQRKSTEMVAGGSTIAVTNPVFVFPLSLFPLCPL